MPAVNPNASSSREKRITIRINDILYDGREGQTVAAVLAANSIRVYRHTEKSEAPRGIFCGMGICYDCLVTINGVANQRACVTLIESGMRIATGMKEHYGS
jgi:predicted molibdopterin-dependent oxidoreductase YjgC